jgi:hypothetical protein
MRDLVMMLAQSSGDSRLWPTLQGDGLDGHDAMNYVSQHVG